MARNLFAEESFGRNLFAEQQPQRESSFTDIFTGADRETDEISKLEEIGGADELSQLSFPSFKTALGLLTTGEPEQKIKIIKENFPDATFRKDEKGNDIVSFESGEYALNKPGFSIADLLGGIAQAAAFTPAGRAKSLGGAALGSGVTQAAIEGAKQLTGGDFEPENIAESAALGGAFKGAEDLIGAGYRAATGGIDPAKQAAIDTIESQGLKARTSDVIPADTLPGKMAESVGELNPLSAGQQQAQQQKRQEITEQFTSKYIPSFDEIKSSVARKKNAIESKALDARNTALSKASGVSVSKENTVNAIDKEIQRLTTLPNGQARAVIDDSAVAILQGYKDDVINSSTVNDLADLRTTFREKLSPDFGTKSSVRDGAIKQVYGAMTKDMDETVKQAVSPNEYRQYKRGNAIYGREAQKLKKGRIKNILQGGDELSPEQIEKTILNKDSVIRSQLYNSLDTQGRENARAALINKLAKDSSKNDELSVNQFLTKLNNNNDAVKTFFRGNERKQLNGLRKALEATRSAQNAAVNPPTGQRLAPFLIGGGALADLGTTTAALVGSGAFSRAYQSRPVRNALLKLNNTPKGTKKFEEALEDLAVIMNGVAQSQSN